LQTLYEFLRAHSVSGFIAGLNPDISYSLLAFHPQFRMADLPVTPLSLARRCLAGLRRVFIGNEHLLSG
jgi:pyruvate formate lyase activating enzyme